jgi:UDP-N-acetylglucosamine--dolichyl-phosphate N-acetylglucosaminephosphotransferase
MPEKNVVAIVWLIGIIFGAIGIILAYTLNSMII